MGMAADTCIFCEIAAGRIPCTKLAEDESTMAFVDIHPKAEVHFLVVPKVHIGSLVEVPETGTQLLGQLLQVVQKVARQQGIDRDGYKVIINVGRNGGQVVPHLHVHCLGGRGVIGVT
jgi:histidine triad (HIT) family protein